MIKKNVEQESGGLLKDLFYLKTTLVIRVRKMYLTEFNLLIRKKRFGLKIGLFILNLCFIFTVKHFLEN